MANVFLPFDDQFIEATTTVINHPKSEFKSLLTLRRNLRISATKTANSIKDVIKPDTSLSKNFADTKIKKLHSLKQELSKIDKEITISAMSENLCTVDELDKLHASCEDYQDKIDEAIVYIRNCVDAFDEQVHSENFNNSQNVNQSIIHDSNNFHAKLPNMNLPEFSGNKTEYLDFITTFESALANRSLTNIDKFLYLKGQLKGDPLTLIKKLPYRDLRFEW